MSEFTRGWKIAIVIALVVALANSGMSTLGDREQRRFENHEGRIDELENMVRGNDVGTASRENSHNARIEFIEKRLEAMAEQPDVETTDLLEALQMEMWRARVNEDANERISAVSLLVKTKGNEPTNVATIDLDDGPGTLLVFIQDAQDQRYRVGVIYRGDDGSSGSNWGFADDPFAEVVGLSTASGAGVGRPGTIALISSGDPGGDDITQNDSAGFFLKND